MFESKSPKSQPLLQFFIGRNKQNIVDIVVNHHNLIYPLFRLNIETRLQQQNIKMRKIFEIFVIEKNKKPHSEIVVQI